MELTKQLVQFATEQQMWQAGDTIIVAVSGGPDSMCLLHALKRVSHAEQIKIVAAHVNHGFRPVESAAEQTMVEQFATSLEIPLETIQLQMPAIILATKANAQVAAREQRYQFLQQVAISYGTNFIALAHHGDDQAETVLMHLIRGSGLSGLSGMRAVRQEKQSVFIRPLLRMNKMDIISYCEQHAVPFMIDSSNLQKDYIRNQIRHDVIPFLSHYNQQLPDALQRVAEIVSAEDEWLQEQTQQFFNKLVTIKQEQCIISLQSLNQLHVALQRRLIKLILSYLSNVPDGFSFERIEAIRAMTRANTASTSRIEAGWKIEVRKEYDHIRFLYQPSFHQESAVETVYPIYIAEVTTLQQFELPHGWRLTLERVANTSEYTARTGAEAQFDLAAISFPLMIRTREPGDRMNVLGLKGSKKVQDMFVDAKVTQLERERYPLLFDAEERLLWIPGIRRSSIGLVNVDTKAILRIVVYQQ
ncbi:tRNA lysidine(34) synthetase TilS [Paenibacillus yanchengensis]|uniref:tRNA(Ile)-lysidine synthase n=1 Tax=Paenibacillus yanchengensis TaxID=2035833 RepID=A0ABW4YIL7_9BACL